MLPYNTLQEAEAAMGDRALTAAEALWFRYTASLPDSWLFFLNIFFVFLVFHVFSIPSLMLDVLARSVLPSLRRFKLQPNSFLSVASLRRCYTGVMFNYISVVLPLSFFANPVFKLVGVRTSLPLPSVWEILVQITVYSLVEDYVNYWLHRGFHMEWVYDNFHYKHHEFSAPTGLCGPYTEGMEILLASVPIFLVPAIIPGHVVTLWLWFALRQLLALEIHSGYDFPWSPTKLIPFLVTADYHDYHHAVGGKSQGNLGSLFTFCDYLYGTSKGYSYKKRLQAAKSKCS